MRTGITCYPNVPVSKLRMSLPVNSAKSRLGIHSGLCAVDSRSSRHLYKSGNLQPRRLFIEIRLRRVSRRFGAKPESSVRHRRS